jgi:hypothetical protein
MEGPLVILTLQSECSFEDLGIDGRIILKLVLKEIGRRSVYRIYLVHSEDRWRALVIRVMNIQVSQNAANILTN